MEDKMPNFERIPHGGQREKTSHSDPLWFAVVTPGPKFGRIGITLCPGKHDADGGKYDGGTYWKRDLATDLDAIRDWGARAVVTLLGPVEMTLLRVERLGDEVKGRDMLWFHLPIVDVSIPDEQFEQQWEDASMMTSQ
jgi:hypothetical protein